MVAGEVAVRLDEERKLEYSETPFISRYPSSKMERGKDRDGFPSTHVPTAFSLTN
jgi:hypothetical protein